MPAHINEETYIMGGKGHDFHTLPLCYHHHAMQHADREFWLKLYRVKTYDEVRKIAERRYLAWSGEKELPCTT